VLDSGHMLLGSVQVIQGKRAQWPTWLICVAILAAHVLLDILPHLEPSMFGDGDYTSPHSLKFWWTMADIAIGGVFLLRFARQFPIYRGTFIMVFLATTGPDSLVAWIVRGLPGSEWLGWYNEFHTWLHWWKILPIWVTIPIGTLYWLGVSGLSLLYMRRAAQGNVDTLQRQPAMKPILPDPTVPLLAADE
jgi:hypothetical protein